MASTLIFALDSPQYHLLEKDASNRFSGLAFDYHSKPVQGINVYQEDRFVGNFPVNTVSEDIHRHFSHIPSTRNCRFAFDLFIDSRAAFYALEIVYEDDSIGDVIRYGASEITARQDWFDVLHGRLKNISSPSGDLVFETQGIRDVTAYNNSIIPGIYNMQTYLTKSGVELNRIKSVLDIGCGTGRLLVGWYLDNPDRHLFGCDINPSLVDWAGANLPDPMRFRQNGLLPPLPYQTGEFDLVYLVSVFTHLSLEAQKLWLSEIKRILAPNGILLATLHGDIYIQLSQPAKYNDFQQQGYLEVVHRNEDEGSNNYAAYHGLEFAEELFHDFDLIGYYPRGNMETQVLFPVAAFQDVYVFKKNGATAMTI